MGDAELTAMLERATDEPPTALVPSMLDLVESELAALVEPPPVRSIEDSSNARRRRRWVFGVVGAVAASTVLVLGAVALRSDSDGDTVDSGPADATPSTVDRFLPTTWPTGMEGPTETLDMSVVGPGRSSTLLAFEGRAAAGISVTPTGLAPDESGTSDNGVSLDDGRRGGVMDTPDGLAMIIGLGPDSSAYLSARAGTEQAVLESFSPALTDEGALIADRLPTGWAPVDDPSGAVRLAFGVSARTSLPWSMATRSGPDSGAPRAVLLMTGVAEDPAAAMEQIRSLDPDAVDVEIRDGLDGVIVQGAASAIRSLVFSPADGALAIVTGKGISDAERIQVAASLRPVSEDEWNESVTRN